MKHTEGPWHVWSEQYPRVGPSHNCTVAGVFACPQGDQQANAQLIAAAPDLFRLLKESVSTLADTRRPIEDWLNEARSVIAKVENRECHRA